MLSILIADDYDLIRTLVRDIVNLALGETEVVFHLCSTGEAVLEHLEAHRADLIICDHSFGRGLTGLEVLRRLRAGGNATPFILHTGEEDRDRKIGKELEVLGAHKLLKASRLDAFESLVRQLLPHAGAEPHYVSP